MGGDNVPSSENKTTVVDFTMRWPSPSNNIYIILYLYYWKRATVVSVFIISLRNQTVTVKFRSGSHNTMTVSFQRQNTTYIYGGLKYRDNMGEFLSGHFPITPHS